MEKQPSQQGICEWVSLDQGTKENASQRVTERAVTELGPGIYRDREEQGIVLIRDLEPNIHASGGQCPSGCDQCDLEVKKRN